MKKDELNYYFIQTLLSVWYADNKIDKYEEFLINQFLKKKWINSELFKKYKWEFKKNKKEEDLYDIFNFWYKNLKENLSKKDFFEFCDYLFLIMYRSDWEYSDLELRIKEILFL
jgi:hypothetical protein